MPFIARKGTTTVIPEAVSDGVSVECPSCGGEMRARGPFEDGRARHFFHISTNTGGGAGCGGGGESDPHRKMKSMAVSGLRHLFDSYQRCEPEVTLDVTHTPTAPEIRRADALVEFNETNAVYGNGVIVEVQYRNKTKNIRETTHDYLALGYSVYWATEDDFTEDRFLIDELTTAFDHQDEPTAFAPSFSTPPPVFPGEPPAVQDREPNGPWTPIDPTPECQHEFIPREKSGEECLRCGLRGEDRFYDKYHDKYRDTYSYSPRPEYEREFVFYKESLSNTAPEREFIESGHSNHLHDWHQVNEIFGGTKYSCFCGATMIVTRDKVQIKHDDGEESRDSEWRPTVTGELGEEECDHEWEEQGVTRVCTKCDKEIKPWDE